HIYLLYLVLMILTSSHCFYIFSFNATATTEIYTLSLHDALPISELNKNEVIKICEICMDAKAEFIKTSTGYSKSGATLTAVKIIKKTVKDKAKIKASGGIRDYETAIKYLEAGADRIGTSAGVSIANMALAASSLN